MSKKSSSCFDLIAFFWNVSGVSLVLSLADKEFKLNFFGLTTYTFEGLPFV